MAVATRGAKGGALLRHAALVVCVLLVPRVHGDGPNEAAQADGLVGRLLQACAQVRDYAVVLTKQQWIRGELRPIENIRLKHQRTPECRYLMWSQGPYEGREILHCANRDAGNMRVHEGSLLSLVTLSLDPLGKRARRDDLRPVTETGIYTVAEIIRGDHAHHLSSGGAQVRLSRRAVHGQPSTCMMAPNGAPRPMPYAPGRREICVHDSLGLPTEVMLWSDVGELMEHYTFRDYVLNPGFGDADFDPANAGYRF